MSTRSANRTSQVDLEDVVLQEPVAVDRGWLWRGSAGAVLLTTHLVRRDLTAPVWPASWCVQRAQPGACGVTIRC